MNSDDWYYVASEGERGPATLRELVALARSGVLRRTDPVWPEGTEEKRFACEVKGLFPSAPPLPISTTSRLTPVENFDGLLVVADASANRVNGEAGDEAEWTQTPAQPAHPAGPLASRHSARPQIGKRLFVACLMVGFIGLTVAVAALVRGSTADRQPKSTSGRPGDVAEVTPAVVATKPERDATPPEAKLQPDSGLGGATPLVPPDAGVPKDAEPKTPPRPPMPEPKAAVPVRPEPKTTVPSKPKLIPVYKVVFPGDVLLTTNEEEAKAIDKRYPGKFSGKAGHHVGTIGYAYAERQPDAVSLRRYLTPGTGRHAYWVGEPPNPGHKAEGPGTWVPAKAVEGASRRLVLFRKDAAGTTEYEYGTDRHAEFFQQKLGYRVGMDREFYLFDAASPP